MTCPCQQSIGTITIPSKLDLKNPLILYELKELIIYTKPAFEDIAVVKADSTEEAKRITKLKMIRNTRYYDQYTREYMMKIADAWKGTGKILVDSNGVPTLEGIKFLIFYQGGVNPQTVSTQFPFFYKFVTNLNPTDKVIVEPPFFNETQKQTSSIISPNILAMVGVIGVAGLAFMVLKK